MQILKTLCGLSVPAIARALLTTEATVQKRLYRTRLALREVRFDLPAEAERPAALETVHTALYLLFNEGYLPTGDKPILDELCRDAMLLAKLLVDEAAFANSHTVALLALMCFTAAAIPLVEEIYLAGRLPHSHVVAAVLANLYARASPEESARRFLDEALARARTPHERDLIARQVNRFRTCQD